MRREILGSAADFFASCAAERPEIAPVSRSKSTRATQSMHTKSCKTCGAKFKAKNSTAIYCSNACRMRMNRGSLGRPERFPSIRQILQAEERKMIAEMMRE
jgi:hypothetical protein